MSSIDDRTGPDRTGSDQIGPEQRNFSAQFEANYSIEKKRAARKRREDQEAAEIRERERIRGIFSGTGINGKI